MLVGVSQLRLLVSVPSKRMRSRPLELPWLPSTLLPVPAPRPWIMLNRRIAGCGWRESAGLGERPRGDVARAGEADAVRARAVDGVVGDDHGAVADARDGDALGGAVRQRRVR